jgi:hypothetical protein
MIPVLLLCGEAGSGKDTVASYIEKVYPGVTPVGQADVLKHMAAAWFGFSNEQLYGPSESRNALDTSITKEFLRDVAGPRVQHSGPDWVERFFPNKVNHAHSHLLTWFYDIVTPEAEKLGGISPRFVLQTLGTEWGRDIDSQVWCRYANDVALKLLGGGYSYSRSKGLKELLGHHCSKLVIITDGRFPNETIETKSRGGWACEVVRPRSTGSAAAQAAGVKGHVSETMLGQTPLHFYDFRLMNDRGLSHLYLAADRLARSVMREPEEI